MGLENPLHIAILLIIVLLVFGAKRLPEMGRSLGSGLRGFKDAINGDSNSHELSHLTAPEKEAEPVAQAPAQPAAVQPERAPAPQAEYTDAEYMDEQPPLPAPEQSPLRAPEPRTERRPAPAPQARRAPEPRTERRPAPAPQAQRAETRNGRAPQSQAGSTPTKPAG